MRKIISELIYKLTADDKGLKSATKNAQKESDNLKKKFELSGAAVVGLGLAAVAAYKKISDELKESIRLYGIQEDAERGLEQAIRDTGGSVGELLPKYKDLASSIQEVTTEGDESTIALIQVATSLGVTEDKIEDATKGAIGLSKAFGIGTQQAVRGIANALEGNFSTLERYIPALRTANDETEKLDILNRAMAGGFNLAKAQSDSAYGALLQYDNAVGDLKEEVGRFAAEAAEPFVRVLTSFATRVAAARSETREFQKVLDALQSGDVSDIGIDQLRSNLEAAKIELENIEAQTKRAEGFNTDAGKRRIEDQKSLIRSLENEITQKRILEDLNKQAAKGAEELREQEIKNAEAAAENARINRIAAEKRIEIAQDYTERIAKIELDSLSLIEREREKALDDAARSYVKTGNEIEQINKFYDLKRVEELQRIKKEEEDLEEEKQKTIDEIKNKYAEIEKNRQDQILEKEERDAERQKQIAKEVAKAKIDASFQFANQAIDLFAAIGQASSAENNAELQRLQDIVDATEEGSVARQIAEDDLNQRKKEIAREEAKRQKQISTFQAIVDTAAAVIGFLANPGGLAGVVLSAAAGVTGLAQIAAIQSEPIPSFATGGSFVVPPGFDNDSFPITSAMVQSGERVTVEPAGGYSQLDGGKPMIINLELDGRVLARSTADYFNGGQVRVRMKK